VKRLAAIRLVNWYHFTDQVLRIDGSALLMGDSGSGKSTVLDAVQLALVADLTEVRFNKAANEHSRRSLYGYVRHKLGSEDESNPGQQRYGRAACTSYVLLEFSDEDSPDHFVAGIGMDATESDTQVPRIHFVMPKGRVEDVPLLDEDGLIRPTRLFRVVARGRNDVKVAPDVNSYRDEVRHRLGILPVSFHRLIVKALDFKPIGQVRQFVFDYLLDERRVDTESLQSNLENYKRLESEAKAAAQRLKALDELCEQGDRLEGTRRTIESHRYVSLTAGHERLESEHILADVAAADTARDLEATKLSKELAEKHVEFLDSERFRIEGLLTQQRGYQQLKELERDLERTEDDLRQARDADAEARRVLGLQRTALESLLNEELRDLRRRRPDLFGDDEIVGVASLPEIVERLRRSLETTGALRGRDLTTWNGRLGRAYDLLNQVKIRLDDLVKQVKVEGKELESELKELDRVGRQRYSDPVNALLHLLRAKLKGTREPQPFCELVEVPNERWRNAVEGYLNTRRFDLIVAPEDFARALSLYERNKASYHLPDRGNIFIGGVGLVDIERIESHARRVDRASLARQIETDDPLARSYCDYLLGDVICCDSEQDLRRHSRGITDTVMVYQNYVARQTPRDVYARWYLGQRAVARRRDAIELRLKELSDAILEAASDLATVGGSLKACDKARLEAGQLVALIASAEEVSDLTKRVATLKKQIDAVDKTAIDALQVEKRAIDDDLKTERTKVAGLNTRIGQLDTELKVKMERVEELATAAGSALAAVEAERAGMKPERRKELDDHYEQLRSMESPATLEKKYDTQRKNIESRLDGLVRRLVSMKTEYANTYGFSGDVESDQWDDFANEREVWRDSHLPAYHDKIARAKDEAIQQLAEDVIFRLRENLLDVKRQLDDLNVALKEVAFGSDRYTFEREVARDHKQFYDLIMEASHFEKESLFGAAASTEARKTLEDLFERLVSGDAQDVRTELEARADYREYFNYDIRIHHADRTYSSFDKVAGDKSGGETQTPYYIAIFASLFRMYRRRAADKKPSCGLILLDEAFAKMDESRTRATLRFARELGLQLVIAAAQGKSEFVAPGVETTLLVVKSTETGMPTVLDFTKEFELHEQHRVADQNGDTAEAVGSPRAQ
jgi:uncharacterized protein YPO0396